MANFFLKMKINRKLEEVAGILGLQPVTFHSKDDRAKVAIGLPASEEASTNSNAYGVSNSAARSRFRSCTFAQADPVGDC